MAFSAIKKKWQALSLQWDLNPGPLWYREHANSAISVQPHWKTLIIILFGNSE